MKNTNLNKIKKHLNTLKEKCRIEFEKLCQYEAEAEELRDKYYNQNDVYQNLNCEILELSLKIQDEESKITKIKAKQYTPAEIKKAKEILKNVGVIK